MNNLAENSVSYNEEAYIYALFSQAEDYPNYVLNELIQLTQQKNVIDVGCGNGKYAKLLKPYVHNIIGMDKAISQLILAQHNNPDIPFFQGDATDIALLDNSQETVLSCWMLGTILESNRQLQALHEMKRICSKQVVLVENNIGSQFELLRGRNPLYDNRTHNYNSWLLEQGFVLHKTIHTYFQFDSIKNAQLVFNSIWGNRLTQDIENNIIEHSINIYVFNK